MDGTITFIYNITQVQKEYIFPGGTLQETLFRRTFRYSSSPNEQQDDDNFLYCFKRPFDALHLMFIRNGYFHSTIKNSIENLPLSQIELGHWVDHGDEGVQCTVSMLLWNNVHRSVSTNMNLCRNMDASTGNRSGKKVILLLRDVDSSLLTTSFGLLSFLCDFLGLVILG